MLLSFSRLSAPKQLYNIIGKKAQRTIKTGELIALKKLSR